MKIISLEKTWTFNWILIEWCNHSLFSVHLFRTIRIECNSRKMKHAIFECTFLWISERFFYSFWKIMNRKKGIDEKSKSSKLFNCLAIRWKFQHRIRYKCEVFQYFSIPNEFSIKYDCKLISDYPKIARISSEFCIS